MSLVEIMVIAVGLGLAMLEINVIYPSSIMESSPRGLPPLDYPWGRDWGIGLASGWKYWAD